MALDTILRSGIATIKKVTDSLQPYVTHKAWKGQDGYGAPIYNSPVQRKAIVEKKVQMRRTESGELVLTTATVMFIEPVPPLGAADRSEPVDPRDVIILPDGSTGAIVNVSGFVDRVTGRPFYSEIWLG